MAITHSGGGGLVRAHTTDLQCPVLCQLCPGRQPPAGWEIPRERMATVGLIPFHLQKGKTREEHFFPQKGAHILV